MFAQSDSLFATPDSVPSASDSILKSGSFELSEDSIDAIIDYRAKGDIVYDNLNRKVHLYNDASIQYTTLSLRADYIQVDFEKNEARASGLKDSTGRMQGLPLFKDGEQFFQAHTIRYNFETRKAFIGDIVSQEGDIVVHGSRTKFIGSDPGDTTSKDVIYNENALFTTCKAKDPHFGIRSNKQKMIPGKLVVVGPSNLVIEDIPTPLWLPFGFFPLKSGKRTGLIFPRDYEYSQRWGFGLREVGYFFPINDYMDLKLTGDIYLRGSFGLKATSRYEKRYKYSGTVSLAYSNYVMEHPETAEKQRDISYSLNWRHNQDRKAHPTRSFGGNIRIQTNDYRSLNDNSAQAVLDNQLTSNLNFEQRFPGKPYRLTASMNHSQNTRSHRVDITLPKVQFRMNRIQPFQRERRTGPEKWYEKIGFDYRVEAKNEIDATDTTLFQRKTLEQAQQGIDHSISANASFRLLKYFNVSPNISYDETWYFQSLDKRFDPTPTVALDTVYNQDSTDFTLVRDTTSFGRVKRDTVPGFKAFRRFQTGISMNTQIFGTVQFKNGWLRGLRHVIKPNISINYSPDQHRYFRRVDTDSRPEENEPELYSIFDGGIYGVPTRPQGGFTLNYGFSNNFEAKIFSKKDSSERNVRLFNSINVNGSYNFNADSFNFSPVSVSGNTQLFDGYTTLTISAAWSPYAADEEGERIREFYWDTDRRPLRFLDASFNFTSRFKLSELRTLFGSGTDEQQEKGRGYPQEDIWTLFENFNVNHNLTMSIDRNARGDTLIVSQHSLNTRGSIPLTEKWSIRVGNIGYDFKAQQLTYPDLGFSRDLHCWQMELNWQPVRNTYNFSLRVKPGSLDFLKVPYRKNRVDGFEGF